MAKNNLTENFQIKNPCSEDWNEMSGTNKIRFCSHCAKNVNDLSKMTRKEALKIVRASDGDLCVRYIKNPVDDTPVFANRLHQITRRAGVAAGVLGASLTLSTLSYAQGGVSISKALKSDPDAAAQTQCDDEKVKTDGTTATISGTITDNNGAVIPNILVSLTNISTNENRQIVSNGEGFYEFKNLPAGNYNLSSLDVGYQPKSVENINLTEDEKRIIDLAMELSDRAIFDTMGTMIAVSYASDLHRAVANNQLEETKNLLANGANVNQKDENYSKITPLFLAVENGNFELVATLLEFGAKINARDAQRQTPLMRLDEDAAVELVRLLVGYGAKINLADKEGNTALILAAHSAKTEILQTLINEGANVNAQNAEGKTGLMNAAEADNLESVRALLNAGANVNLKNEDGETAYDLTGSEEIENLLISYGAIVDEN